MVCDDSDVCNGVFSCDESVGGLCIETSPPVVCELETPCNLTLCDAVTGECSYAPLVCDDRNLCTANDRCDNEPWGCVFDPNPNST